ncbi:MAG: hypothetical protein MI921_00505 [Cytophagales bacterium]|nr:hypothetical protein [Cytophagales bacterium]
MRPVYDLWGHDPENLYKYSAHLQVGLALAVKEEIPQVKYATRFHYAPGIEVTSGDKASKEKISFVDPDFFSMFSFPVLAGKKEEFLTENIMQ